MGTVRRIPGMLTTAHMIVRTDAKADSSCKSHEGIRQNARATCITDSTIRNRPSVQTPESLWVDTPCLGVP